MRQRGFTLIEIIVSMMIFSIVVVVALAALVKIIDANKKAQSTQDAVIGLSFALESMSRELRTGSKHHCEANESGSVPVSGPQACNIGQNKLIVFQSAVMDDGASPPCRLYYAYRFTGSGPYTLEKAIQAKGNHCNAAVSGFAPVVSSNVTLNDFKLGVSYDSVNQPFPMTFIELSGYAGPSEKVRTYFTVQTTAASRIQ